MCIDQIGTEKVAMKTIEIKTTEMKFLSSMDQRKVFPQGQHTDPDIGVIQEGQATSQAGSRSWRYKCHPHGTG